jgi:hypothetical protein
LPDQSKAPRAETHPLRAPVSAAPPSLAMLQSVVPFSGVYVRRPVRADLPLGVRRAAACRRLAQASCAWNQVMFVEGTSAGRLTA